MIYIDKRVTNLYIYKRMFTNVLKFSTDFKICFEILKKSQNVQRKAIFVNKFLSLVLTQVNK